MNFEIGKSDVISSLESLNAVSLSPARPAASTLQFPKHGISLSAVVVFIEKCGRRDVLFGKTTTEVNELFLKPITQMSMLSYCELLMTHNDEDVGIAEVFISHAWKYYFLDVFDTLVHHFKHRPGIIL